MANAFTQLAIDSLDLDRLGVRFRTGNCVACSCARAAAMRTLSESPLAGIRPPKSRPRRPPQGRPVDNQIMPSKKIIANFISLYARPNTRDWRETERLLKQFAMAWEGRPLAEIAKAGKTPPSRFANAKKRLDKFIARENGKPIYPWIMHDIRRTVATGLAGLGVYLPVIERCLNHVSGSFAGIVGIYQRHSFADEMRSAFESWGRRVEMLASGETTQNVIELSAAARA